MSRSWRLRPLLMGLVLAGLLIQMLPAGACTSVLDIRVDCPPTPSPAKRPAGGRAEAAVQALMTKIRAERERHGIPPIHFDEQVAVVAARHAGRMADRGSVFHNRRLGSESVRRAMGHPQIVMENVGVGPSALSIHKAFMRSDGHRRAILDSRGRAVGIGVVAQGRNLWTVEVFVDRSVPSRRRGDDADEGSAGAFADARAEQADALGPLAAGAPRAAGNGARMGPASVIISAVALTWAGLFLAGRRRRVTP